MKIYLAGQNNFGNRGCEALVRSTHDLIKAKYPKAKLLVPTFDEKADKKQWTDVSGESIEFVDTFQTPKELLIWNKIVKKIPFLRRVWEPSYLLPTKISNQLNNVDAVLMIGGDVISLEYGLPSLYQWSKLLDKASSRGIPTMLWAASVGPFDSDKIVEKHMIKHLKKYSAITVRESESFEYLKSLDIPNVTFVADPAFVMKPEPLSLDTILPKQRGDGTLGFNVSPLIAKFRKSESDSQKMREEIISFIRKILTETNFSVLLIPHVDPLNGSEKNSDSFYMKSIFNKLGEFSERLNLAPSTLNAAQLKYLLSNCRFFIGARTHATIGALSMEVPTISIAYSVKAKGLNKDLFGDTRYVLNTPEVSLETLWSSFKLLQNDETEIKKLLEEKIPVWRKRSAISAETLDNQLKRKYK